LPNAPAASSPQHELAGDAAAAVHALIGATSKRMEEVIELLV